MSKDRFKIAHSANLARTTKAFKEAHYVKTTTQPVRKYDERWAAGKFKGQKVSDTPKTYIEWVISNWKGLTVDQTNLLNKFLAQ